MDTCCYNNLYVYLSQVDDQELAIVFMKVDANCDGTVDWVRDKLIKYNSFYQ